MILKRIKKYIEFGYLAEARLLIDQQFDADAILKEELNEQSGEKSLPLLIMCTLISNEDTAFNFCDVLVEKGYKINLTDANGLCALNYAIIFEKLKLVELYLKTFNFNLTNFYDCYNNSLLHYVYAINNLNITELFINVYKKYYQWSFEFLSNIKNCDDLSVLDLYNYSNLINNYNNCKQSLKLNQVHRTKSINRKNSFSNYPLDLKRPFTAISTKNDDNIYRNSFLKHIPTSKFYKNSNPLFIAKQIKRFYDSKLNLKVFGVIDKNKDYFLNANKDSTFTYDKDYLEFKYRKKKFINVKALQTNMLFKIKLLNRAKSCIKVPLLVSSTQEEEPVIAKPELSNQIVNNNKNDENKNIFLHEQNKLNDGNKSIKPLKNSLNYDNWKYNIDELLYNYATIHTPSFRKGVNQNANNIIPSQESTTVETNSLKQQKTNDDFNVSLTNSTRSNDNLKKQQMQQACSEKISEKSKNANFRQNNHTNKTKS